MQAEASMSFPHKMIVNHIMDGQNIQCKKLDWCFATNIFLSTEEVPTLFKYLSVGSGGVGVRGANCIRVKT